MQSLPPRLKIKNITCTFGGRDVISNSSFEVHAGETLCLLGPSGCGKTTTLRTIAGIQQANHGEIWLDGKMIEGATCNVAPEARSVGFLFQDFALFPHLNVSANVGFGLRLKGDKKKQRILELLKNVEMQDYAHAFPHELSGGEQQRVALARALAPMPKVMLLDEPFSGLDNRLRNDVRRTTLRLLRATNTSIIMVTHDPDEAMRMSDKIALMRAGKIVQIGTPRELYNSPIDLETAAFFSDLNIVKGTVKNAQIETIFGNFTTENYHNGTKVNIAIRPQHLRIDFDRCAPGPRPSAADGLPVRAKVIEANFTGHESIILFRTEEKQHELQASTPGLFLPKPGRHLFLSLKRDRCFLFPQQNI